MYSKEQYSEDIDMVITRDGRVAISMSEINFTKLVNHLYDGSKYLEGKGLKESSKDVMEFWRALIEKEDICREVLKVNPEEVE